MTDLTPEQRARQRAIWSEHPADCQCPDGDWHEQSAFGLALLDALEAAEARAAEAELARDGARAILDHQICESAALRERVSALAAQVLHFHGLMEGVELEFGMHARLRELATAARALVPAPGSDPGATREEKP